MKNLFSTIRSWFSPKQQYASEVALLRLEYESRIQHLECVIKRHSVMLQHDKVSVTTSEDTLKAHFDCVVSESVMKWLTNWADERYAQTDDMESLVEDAISNSNCVDDAVECKLDNEDWDYRLRDSLDWDKVAERVVEKIDWQDVVRDNDILTTDDIDTDDLMLKSDHLSEDDLVTRDELSDMVIGELNRDWFEQKLKEEVMRHFKDTLMSVRNTEEDNCRNAIDDAIEAKVDVLIGERMTEKFGPSFDIWFHNLIAHCVKTVITEMVKAAYEESVKSSDEGEVSNG
jgi:hypothetical protein